MSTIGLGGESKERGTVLRARVSEREYDLLVQIAGLADDSPKPNVSEAMRFCIMFTGKVMALLPDVVMEAVLDVKEEDIRLEEKKNGRGE